MATRRDRESESESETWRSSGGGTALSLGHGLSEKLTLVTISSQACAAGRLSDLALPPRILRGELDQSIAGRGVSASFESAKNASHIAKFVICRLLSRCHVALNASALGAPRLSRSCDAWGCVRGTGSTSSATAPSTSGRSSRPMRRKRLRLQSSSSRSSRRVKTGLPSPRSATGVTTDLPRAEAEHMAGHGTPE